MCATLKQTQLNCRIWNTNIQIKCGETIEFVTPCTDFILTIKNALKMIEKAVQNIKLDKLAQFIASNQTVATPLSSYGFPPLNEVGFNLSQLTTQINQQCRAAVKLFAGGCFFSDFKQVFQTCQELLGGKYVGVALHIFAPGQPYIDTPEWRAAFRNCVRASWSQQNEKLLFEALFELVGFKVPKQFQNVRRLGNSASQILKSDQNWGVDDALWAFCLLYAVEGFEPCQQEAEDGLAVLFPALQNVKDRLTAIRVSKM